MRNMRNMRNMGNMGNMAEAIARSTPGAVPGHALSRSRIIRKSSE
jgi:hypothetical protein